jgi:hypothetical protein
MSTIPASAAPRRLVTVVGLVLPLALIAVSAVLMLVALPSAPDEVIINWGVDGHHQTGPAWTFPAITALTGAGIPLVLWATGVRGRQVSDSSVLLASVGLAIAAMLAVVMPWMLIAQPTDALVPTITGLAIGIGLGAGSWFLLPRDPSPASTAIIAEPISRPSGATSVWTMIARMPLGARLGIAGGILMSAIAVAIIIVVGGSAGWWSLMLPVVLTIAFLTTTEFRVTAGPAGLIVRSAIGWPTYRIPAAEIERVEVTAVDPMADFGGWGLRIGFARGGAPRRPFGVVLRRGEAIEVRRRDGRGFVVTVDDAAIGAAVLAAAARDAAVVR